MTAPVTNIASARARQRDSERSRQRRREHTQRLDREISAGTVRTRTALLALEEYLLNLGDDLELAAKLREHGDKAKSDGDATAVVKALRHFSGITRAIASVVSVHAREHDEAPEPADRADRADRLPRPTTRAVVALLERQDREIERRLRDERERIENDPEGFAP